jgi:uncharacterized protein (DUF488 family)
VSLILTLGHSNLTLDAFLHRLLAHDVHQLADVRRYPSSRRHPHFSSAPLAHALAEAGVAYRHFVGLGGHREPEPGNRHLALREPALRGYASHLATEEFRRSLDALLEWARSGRTTILCAERLPEACHRRLLSDALVHRGIHVEHILDDATRRTHAITPSVRIEAGELIYDAGGALSFDLG